MLIYRTASLSYISAYLSFIRGCGAGEGVVVILKYHCVVKNRFQYVQFFNIEHPLTDYKNMYRDTSDADFLCTLEEILAAEPSASQRGIAERTDISLGLVNTRLSQLAERGWLSVAPAGGRKVRYSLTASGADVAAAKRMERMKKTFSLMRHYVEALGNSIRTAKEQGMTRVVLCGESDLRFLVEYACEREDVEFLRGNGDGAGGSSDGSFLIAGEACGEEGDGIVSVFDIVDPPRDGNK